MNLLPRPRHLDLGDALVSARPPVATLHRSLPAQGYELRIDADGVQLRGGDDAGLFYGRATLDQLARLFLARVDRVALGRDQVAVGGQGQAERAVEVDAVLVNDRASPAVGRRLARCVIVDGF